MKKTEDGKFLLNPAELAALIGASMETATKVLHDPMFDPNDDGLPFFVNRGYKLLYGTELYTDEELDGIHDVGGINLKVLSLSEVLHLKNEPVIIWHRKKGRWEDHALPVQSFMDMNHLPLASGVKLDLDDFGIIWVAYQKEA